MSSDPRAGVVLGLAMALGALGAEPSSEGAPVAEPNVAVHVIQPRAFAEQGLRELVLFPLVPQLNGRFTQHLGTMGSFVWHVGENLGLRLTVGGNWMATESSFNAELATKGKVAAQAAASLLWTWGLLGGVEVSPVHGKFVWLDGLLGHFSLVLSAGAGAGGSAHQLKPQSVRDDGTVSPATYGDTGVRFLGSVGLGARVRLGAHLALRLEVHDVISTARVDQVNGCSVDDLAAMDGRLRAGFPVESTPVRPGCDLRAFSGQTPAGDNRSIDLSQAYQLVKGDHGVPSADVLHNVGLYLGIAFLF